MINTIYFKILNMGITAGWLVCALLLFRIAVPKAPKWLRCALWGLVALRLTVPYSVKSSLSLLRSAQPVTEGSGPADAPMVDTGISVIDHTVNPVLGQYAQSNEQSLIAPVRQISAGAVIWIIGAAVMLAYMLFSYVKLKRRVVGSVREEGNIYLCDGLASPFILGIVKPKIYIPSSLQDRDIESVLAHERTHLARKDHWWKPAGYLLLSVYWFNPLIWVAYILLCRDIEYACDEKVIRDMNADERASYSQALLDCSVKSSLITACPLAFGETSVKNRIKAVLHYRKPAFWILILCCVIVTAVTVSLMTDPRMTAETVVVGDSEYEILASGKIEVSDKTVVYYEGGTPRNELTVTCSAKKPLSLDLSGLDQCEEIQVLRIVTEGELKELVLPERDGYSCYISSPKIGDITCRALAAADFVMTAGPDHIRTNEGSVINVSVDDPEDLEFLKEGDYGNVDINTSDGLIPAAGCSIQSLSLKGSDDWDLSSLSGNTSLRYIALIGGTADLSPLSATSIEQIYLNGDYDLNGLAELSGLTMLNVMITEESEISLSPVVILRGAGMKYLNLGLKSDPQIDRTAIRNAKEVEELCSAVPYLARYVSDLRSFVQKGGEIGVFFVSNDLQDDTSLYGNTMSYNDQREDDLHFANQPLSGTEEVLRLFDETDHPGIDLRLSA